MIKRTLLIFLLLLILYAVLSSVICWPSKSLTQWEDNERLISKFLFSIDQRQINTVIVGSSMSFRMSIHDNPYADTVYNLALGGQGLFEGLEVLKRSGHLPKHILIETNALYRRPRNNYASSFFMPGVYQLKQLVTGFRQEYRPVTFAQYLFFGCKGKISQIFKTEEGDFASLLSEEKVEPSPESLFTGVKQQHIEALLLDYSQIVSTTDWQEVEQLLAMYVDYFFKKGVELIFYEMPSEQILLDSELNRMIRGSLKKTFPQISLLRSESLPTTDGIHLDPVIAHQFLHRLLGKI